MPIRRAVEPTEPNIPGSECDEAVRQAGGRFAAVNAIAKRSRQLLRGVPPLVADATPGKSAMTAMREIAAGKVTVARRAPNLLLSDFRHVRWTVEGEITASHPAEIDGQTVTVVDGVRVTSVRRSA